jgi:hypothetical protein
MAKIFLSRAIMNSFLFLMNLTNLQQVEVFKEHHLAETSREYRETFLPVGNRKVNSNISRLTGIADFECFSRESTLTYMEEEALKSTTIDDARQVISGLQTAQEESGDLMYMGRLEPTLVSMQQFGEVAESLKMFNDVSHAMAYVWVSLVCLGCYWISILTNKKN